jgi:hypothetical protein
LCASQVAAESPQGGPEVSYRSSASSSKIASKWPAAVAAVTTPDHKVPKCEEDGSMRNMPALSTLWILEPAHWCSNVVSSLVYIGSPTASRLGFVYSMVLMPAKEMPFASKTVTSAHVSEGA